MKKENKNIEKLYGINFVNLQDRSRLKQAYGDQVLFLDDSGNFRRTKTNPVLVDWPLHELMKIRQKWRTFIVSNPRLTVRIINDQLNLNHLTVSDTSTKDLGIHKMGIKLVSTKFSPCKRVFDPNDFFVLP